MENKITKGAWEVDDRGSGSLRICVNPSDPINQQTICLLGGRASDPDIMANAKLIAAAPELLSICLEFCEKVESGKARSTKTYGRMKSILEKI